MIASASIADRIPGQGEVVTLPWAVRLLRIAASGSWTGTPLEGMVWSTQLVSIMTRLPRRMGMVRFILSSLSDLNVFILPRFLLFEKPKLIDSHLRL